MGASGSKVSTMAFALVEVTTTSVNALTAAVVFTYDITVWFGCSLIKAANSSAGQLSANEHPAAVSGTNTIF